MTKARILIFSLTFYTSLSTRIFDFNGQVSENGISYAVLANIPETTLPNNFIFCSSHFQKSINTKNVHSIYVIYQEVEMVNPWLSIGIWSENILWVNIAYKYWYALGSIPDEFMNKWIHICLKIDVNGKTIEGNVNGRTLKNVSDIKGLKPTPKLYLQLGIVNNSYSVSAKQYQFHGQIANIHLIKGGKRNLTLLSKSTCEMEKSTNVFQWSHMKWTKVKIVETFLDKSFICDDKYSLLRVPYTWTISESDHVCSRFGNGQIAGIVNPTKPKNATFQKQIYGNDDDCPFFWTSYIYYKNSSGEVIDIYTNSKLYILWALGYPIRGLNLREYSEVVFLPNQAHFINLEVKLKGCLLCNTSSETIYTIRGSCPFSFMG